MSKYDLNYFVDEEKNGTIFAKISKSSSDVRGKGGYFPYQDYIGKVIKPDKKITILPIEMIGYFFHYGDNLTIFSFSRLSEVIKSSEFEAVDNVLNPGCFDINTAWVKKVKSLKDVDTIKYLLSFPPIIKYLESSGNLAASHLESRGFDKSAKYLREQIKK